MDDMGPPDHFSNATDCCFLDYSKPEEAVSNNPPTLDPISVLRNVFS